MSSDLITTSWTVDITALTSIVHKDDARTGGGTHTLFRREKIVTATGDVALVPIVSGNAWRGILRRTGETLIAEVLDYAGHLTTPAAYLLRNGGALRKTTTTFTPADERRLKGLVPLIGLFGGAAGGRIMSGNTTVSKLVPVIAETAHLLPQGHPTPAHAAHDILGQESFSHTDDTPAGHTHSDDTPATDAGDPRLRYDLETLIAGTGLHGRIHLAHATPTEYALLDDILDTFATTGHLGARAAAGHGAIRAELHPASAHPRIDWRAALADDRDDALAALGAIT